MSTQFNGHAVRAIYRFEMARMWRTIAQSIASPVISTSLYFIVFGSAIGSRMTQIDGPPAALAYQGAYIQDLSAHTDCPEVDVEAVAETFLQIVLEHAGLPPLAPVSSRMTPVQVR